METTEAGAQLLELHGFGARGQRGGQPERGPNNHEQYGQIARAPARIFVVCLGKINGRLEIFFEVRKGAFLRQKVLIVFG